MAILISTTTTSASQSQAKALNYAYKTSSSSVTAKKLCIAAVWTPTPLLPSLVSTFVNSWPFSPSQFPTFSHPKKSQVPAVNFFLSFQCEEISFVFPYLCRNGGAVCTRAPGRSRFCESSQRRWRHFHLRIRIVAFRCDENFSIDFLS